MAKAAQTGLIGRDAELARIEEFLGAIGSGPAALLLEGEIGIGKTALWTRGLVHMTAGPPSSGSDPGLCRVCPNRGTAPFGV